MQVLREEIETEKRAQEAILRDFKTQVAVGAKPFALTAAGASSGGGHPGGSSTDVVRSLRGRPMSGGR